VNGAQNYRVEFEIVVEQGKVREFARAVQATSPEYFVDPTPAIPPTFLVTQALWLGEENMPIYRVGIDLARTLHAEEAYVFHGPPPRAGTHLRCVSYLSDVYEKEGRRGGQMRFYVMTTEFRDPDGVLVATGRTTAVQTAGPPAS
jgi:hypothetical protein